jgi:predicted Zn-dependent peptidase
MEQLDKLTDEKVSAKELQKAKDYIKGKTVLELEDTAGMIEWVGMQLLLKGKITSLEELYAKIDAVTGEDVQRVARDLFVDDRLNFTMIAPQQSDEGKLEKLLHFS